MNKEKKYFGQLAENTDQYEQLRNVLELIRIYGESPDCVYAIAAYGAGIGLPGFDQLVEIYKSRISPGYEKDSK